MAQQNILVFDLYEYLERMSTLSSEDIDKVFVRSPFSPIPLKKRLEMGFL